jgi:broad specificity phosphatase PhoE
MTLTKRDGTTIYLVHHGRTAIDEAGKVHGWAGSDEPLTPRGVADAEKAAAFLKTKGVGEVYSSDQARAIQTAEVIRDKLQIEKPNTERLGLRPMNVGTLAGLTDDEVAGPMDDLKARLWARAPGGESMGKFLGRWGQELDRVIHEALEEPYSCAYVTHSHNLATLPYLLSTGVAPIKIKSGVGPGGVIALHVSDDGGQVVIDEQFDLKPSKIDGG